jgi:hypothetical protein
MLWLGYPNELIDFSAQMTVETVPASLIKNTAIGTEPTRIPVHTEIYVAMILGKKILVKGCSFDSFVCT